MVFTRFEIPARGGRLAMTTGLSGSKRVGGGG